MADDTNFTEKGPWFPQDMEAGKRKIVRNMVLAAKNGDEETVIEILKSKEVDVDSKYKWETTLMVAARNNNISLCKILLDYGADCNISRVMQQTALWIAAYHGNLQVMELMIATRKCSQANLDNALRRCVTMNFLHGCDALLRAGADVQAADSMGVTNLHVAAGSIEEYDSHRPDHWKFLNQDSWRVSHTTDFETCELLLMWKADVNGVDNVEGSPLHYACETGNEDICRLLIENGADVNAVGGLQPKTPLHVAVSKDFPKLVKMFLKGQNIQPNMIDHEKDTPLMSAIQLHKKECVRIFLEDDRWVDYMSVVCRGDGDSVNTPMRELIRQMPDMACLVMNKCIELSSHKDPKNPEFTARFYFAFMDDTYASSYWIPSGKVETSFGGHDGPGHSRANGGGKIMSDSPESTLGRRKEINFVSLQIPVTNKAGPCRRKATIVDSTTRPPAPKTAPQCNPRCFNCFPVVKSCILNKNAKPYVQNRRVMMHNHPLFIAYQEKCNSVICHPLAIAMINHKWQKTARYLFYGGLFIYLTFVILLTTHAMLNGNCPQNNLTANAPAANVPTANDTTPNDTTPLNDDSLQILINVISYVLIGICLCAIGKEIVCMVAEFPTYLLRFRHWVDIAIYFSSIVVVSNNLAEVGALKCRDNHALEAVCIFASWFNILLTLRQFPVVGIFFIMFTRILKNSMIVMVVFFPLILGFAFTFTILMGNMMQFRMNMTIPTVIVMLSGEVEYVDTLKNKIDNKEMAIVVFVFFIILMVIGLLNLLVGLAVSDVETLHRESKAEMLSLKAEKVISCEYYLTDIPRKRAACGCLSYQPNKTSFCFGKDRTRLKFRERIMAWFNVFEFSDNRLSPTYLLRTMRTSERTENNYDSIRKDISQLKNQLESSNLLSPRLVKDDSVASTKFEVPGARVLKKRDGFTPKTSRNIKK